MKAWVSKWREAIFSFSLIHNGSAQRAALHVWFFMYLFIWLNSGYPFWHKGICVSSWDWTTGLSFLKWKVQNWAKKKKDTHFFVHLSIYMCFCFWVQWSWPVEIINSTLTVKMSLSFRPCKMWICSSYKPINSCLNASLHSISSHLFKIDKTNSL